jgi:hypothetical protein
MTPEEREQYQAEVRQLRDELARLRNAEPRKRMTLSDVVEQLLARGASEHSSVSLSRNAKGETQIEVTVRSDTDTELPTPDDAAAKAVELYDTLRARYPSSAGYTGPTPAGTKPQEPSGE